MGEYLDKYQSYMELWIDTGMILSYVYREWIHKGWKWLDSRGIIR